jgi:hypothetical protein
MNIQVGNIVKVIDGSYNYALDPKKTELQDWMGLALDSGQFTVLATGVEKLPAKHDPYVSSVLNPKYLYNDTIIQHVNTGKIVFTNSLFLKRLDWDYQLNRPRITCPVCWSVLGASSHCFPAVGDAIKIRDGSFVKTLNSDGTVTNLSYNTRNNELYVIVATGMVNLPTDNDNHWKGITNDTIIKGVDSGRIIFIQINQLSFPHFCSECGKKK